MKSITQGLIQPNGKDLERAVLGAILIEKGAIFDVLDIIPSGDVFYSKSAGLVYKAVLDLFNDGENIDILTVIEQTRKNGDYSLIGGDEKASYYISQLTFNVNSTAHITTHARIIVEKFLKREIIRMTAKISSLAYDDGDVFEVLDKWQNDLMEVSDYATGSKGFSSYNEMVRNGINSIREVINADNDIDGSLTGLPTLDKISGRWEAGDLIIIAARPGMGKTSLVMTIVNHAGINLNKNIAFFSLEMSKEKLILRAFSERARINSYKFKTPKDITDEEFERLLFQAEEMEKANIFIDDQAGLSITQLKTRAKKLAIKLGGLDMVVIDYLQLMKASVKGNREQEIALISRSLKELAKELGCPVVALAQLSRAVETRGGDKKPMLSDLRESGSIEQDADQVMFIYRPEYYKIMEDEEGNSNLGIAEILVEKNRSGNTGVARLKFEGQYTSFSELESEYTYFSEPHQDNIQDYDPLENSKDFEFI